MTSRRTGPLISVDELHERLGQVSVLDVRYSMGGPPGRPEHLAAHVPGAAYVDLDDDLADPPGAGGRHPLPEVERFARAMRRAGVSRSRAVVVMDDWQGRAAARCWWLLRHHGHPDVRVLDGGWSAWRAAGLPVVAGEEAVAPGDFTADVDAHMPVVGPSDVLGVDVLVDARAPERYRGETEPVDPVAGHIPGAVNVATAENLDENGFFRQPEDLLEVYVAVGARPDRTVAAYCGSGVTAAHDVLALELAGVPAALYPGSWSEWVTDPERPVETSVG